MARALLFCCLFCLTTPAVATDYYYDFHPRAAAVYDQIMRLELDEAQREIDRIRERTPTNLVTHHLESYLDFFRLYLSGRENLWYPLEARFERRLTALEAGNPDDPYYRYVLAEARLHRSLVHLRFEKHFAAFREINRANKLLRANAKEHPDFLLTYKDLGLLHAAVGSIPPQYKWGVELFSSLNGTIQEGRKELRRAVNMPDNPFHLETAVLFAYLELHLADDPEGAFALVRNLKLQPATNPLHCFVLANLAMRSGRNDLAIKWLEAQPRGGKAEDFPYLDFMLGLAKLRNLDSGARLHFQSFNFRYGGRHFREEAHQKIAWTYLLENDEAGYFRSLSAIEGGSRAGGDENAVREASRERAPHPGLLRARLLFDGNYCTRARATLNKIDTATLSDPERLEFTYRTGRVLEGLGDASGALSFYTRTITLGRDEPEFFACKAALQAGLVEERRGNYERAKNYFRDCLSIHPEEYKTGLHLLAKAGLSRMTGTRP
ncbi:hypothetical protein [Lewinella sp. W8]|uniref:tetratricopeptide repeat protein n=1 Tax=Lewinella sp. W8 TaxID=2528208 RepID=UPI00106867D1|nr:hypothetical protein [Lewinella sp. W8]MTB51943.1 hypothetical protein [Lewinella sp. W8]